VKALSLHQPWADLLVFGVKDVENRDWSTRHRGLLVIHAARTLDEAAMASVGHLVTRDPPRGVFVGTVEVHDCVRDSPSAWAWPQNWHWLVENAVLLSPPIPWRGMPGLFDVDDSVIVEALSRD
jgi:hypothetical protein